jgi:hypothetical protein
MNAWRTLHKKMRALVTTGMTLAFTALMAGLISACSGGGGGSGGNGGSTNPSSTGTEGIGGIQVAGRLSGADIPPTGTPWPAATPDNVTLDIQEVAISTDGQQYTPILQGPIQYTLTSSDGGVLPALNQLPAGEYGALRLKIDTITWHATWTLSNPSPCDGSTSGQSQGTVALSGHTNLYFMTPSLGGNTLRHYVTKLPISDPNYIGDANNPLLMAAPLLISKDNVSTMSLVLGTSGTLTCSTVSAMSDQGDPNLQLSGPATILKGVSSVYFDADHDEVAVSNTTGNSITVYLRDELASSGDGDIAPERYITGPDTRLNLPRGITLYRDPDPRNNEMIVANSGNNSLTVYGITANGDAAPLRTIAGDQHTALSTPVGVAYRQGDNPPNDDELWVANNGNDTVTVYARITPGDAAPLYTLSGQATGLSAVCGIALYTYNDGNRHDYVLVSNNIRPGTSQGSESIAIFDRNRIATSIHNVANIPADYTIAGDQTGLNKPCGLVFDDAAKEIYVTNTGNGTVTVYDWNALNPGSNNIAPKRTISGLISPQGTTWDALHSQLWIAQRGQQAAMTSLPDMSPVTSDADSSTAPLQGKYNIVSFGVDLSKGVHSLGSTIPIIYSERGTATFNPSAGSEWASMIVNIDNVLVREIMEPNCQIPVDQAINGIYDVDSQGGFHAFLLDQQGSLTGAFHDSGNFFTAAAYDGPSRMYMMLGVKNTGTAVPNLTPGGANSTFAYARYANRIVLNRFDPSAISDNDVLAYLSEIGAFSVNPTKLTGMADDSNLLNITNPMGDVAAPKSGGAVYVQTGNTNTGGVGMTAHPGGRVEIQGASFGISGAATASGDTAIFMSDTGPSDVDNNSCPTILGYSLGIRSNPSLTDADIKGTYYIAAIGDAGFLQTAPGRSTYRVSSGTVTFDGNGGGHLTLAESDEGDIKAQDLAITYVIRNNAVLPSDTTATTTANATVVDIYKTAGDLNPIASAVVGSGGQNMIFYEDLLVKDAQVDRTVVTGNISRLIGFAVYRNP